MGNTVQKSETFLENSRDISVSYESHETMNWKNMQSEDSDLKSSVKSKNFERDIRLFEENVISPSKIR